MHIKSMFDQGLYFSIMAITLTRVMTLRVMTGVRVI